MGSFFNPFGPGSSLLGETVHTFWYGFIGNDEEGDWPSVAYHPSLLGKRSIEEEARFMIAKYGRSKGTQGWDIPPDHPRVRFGNLKLWSQWHNGMAAIQLSAPHPEVDFVGRAYFAGLVKTEWDLYERWAKAIQARNAVSITLLDDDLHRRPDIVQLLVEKFSIVGG